ncbi:MAG: NAD(+) diphosphatase [Burkholderiales bacterium]
MADDYIPLLTPPEQQTGPVLWFAFQRSEMLVRAAADAPDLPCCPDLTEHGFTMLRRQYLGTYGGKHCYAAELDESDAVPAGWKLIGLREAFGHFDEILAALSGRAYQIMDWDRNHQFCGRCGTPTEQRRNERARACPNCGRVVYPPISPAIMVLVTRGRELLLGRRAIWPEQRYSALAGFVEPGETLEQTVVRETREEVGVEIANIRYFGSQPWPFPHSLMIAFTAEYAGGEIRPDGEEIEEARWFDAGQLPQLPPRISISRRLIDAVSAQLAARYPR